jgi:acetyl esterase/lipase
LPPAGPALPVGAWQERRTRFEADTVTMNARLPVRDDVTVVRHEVETPDGAAIGVHVYRPRRPSGALVLYLHGGGHFACDVTASDPNCQRYAAEGEAVIVSVDYRRAPEHPHPTPIEDAYAALRWTAANAAELGGEVDRLAVMGDSAGGGMAAGVALLARDRGGPALRSQILIYPMLDDTTAGPDPQVEPFLTWTYDDNVTGWQCLLGERFGTDAVDAYAAPARATQLAGLPPAYIEVGQLDAFRDEDMSYAMRLSWAGVDVELVVRPGAPHDFELIAPDAAVTVRAFADRARVLQTLG